MLFNYNEFLQNYNQIEQRTDEWYSIRKTIISATDAGTILGYNRFSSKNDLLKKKLQEENIMIESPAISHGVFFEPIATKCYEDLNGGIKVHDIGLVIHQDYKWLGASPDGIMENGKLIEIKCLYSRQFKNTSADIPRQYWAQIQIQLEVCNLEECDLYQCIFKKVDRHEYNSFDGIKGKEKRIYWILKDYRCNTIKRDRNWFNNNKKELYDFWLLIKYEQNGSKITNRIKKIKNNLGIDNTWVSVNMIKNWMLNDPIIDWLDMYGDKSMKDKKTDIRFDFKLNLLVKKTNLFANIIVNLKNRFNVLSITDDKECSVTNFSKTVDAIKNKVEIIHNGVLHDNVNKLYGICDLIVRNDIIPQICQEYNFTQELNSKDQNEYYSIVQFKYCTLELNKNSYINKQESSNYYKGECILLQRILNNIMKINYNLQNEKECYILAKNIKKNKEKYIGFKELGIIDICHKKDMDLSIEVDNALNWLKRLKDDGMNWDINKPTIVELYPNMGANMNEWTNYKKILAHKVKEITLITGLGYDKRMSLFKLGICKWNNKEIISKYDNISGIIDINSNGSLNNIIITDKNIFKNNNVKTLKLYIDFETINNYDTDYSIYKSYKDSTTLDLISNNEMIYLIGMGWEENKKWVFKKFLVNNITHSEEKRIIIEWKNYMNDIMKKNNYTNIELYHWTNAECRMFNNSCLRHSISSDLDSNYKWIDLYMRFKNNIYIKGAFDYSLKTIAKTMNKLNMIETKWEDEELNGLSTMIAVEYYNNMGCGLHNIKEIEEIVKYNEVDCKVMWEMLNYIQSIM